MPVFNAGPFLDGCISSVVEQDYMHWELIAVDDNSSDDSDKVLQNWASRDSRIHILENKGSGIIDALQTGYSQCKGQIIHRMDADDLMPREKLSTMLNKLKAKTVVTGKVKYFREDQPVGDGFLTYSNWLNTLWTSGSGWNDIYKECPIASPAWMMYRDDFEGLGGFNSNRLPEDYDLAFRIYKHQVKVEFIDEVVHLWRDSSTRTSRNNEEYFPTAYYPLKVQYFLELDRDRSKPLLLWGAGKKGKLVARLLQQHNETFEWVTNNNKKTGAPIYGIQLKTLKEFDTKKYQSILVVSGPDDKRRLQQFLNQLGLEQRENYFWLC
jgi:glycosyltransferase involved in cell wall biosynthesis